MHTLQINDDLYRLPGTWDELTPAQLEYLARISQSDQPLEQFKLLMLLHCLKARVARQYRLDRTAIRLKVGTESPKVCLHVRRKRYWLTPEEISRMSVLMKWIVTRRETQSSRARRQYAAYEPEYEYFLDSRRTVNPYPRLRIRLHRLKGPEDNLYDITFEQYMYLQTYLDAAVTDPAQLDNLLACLWHTRPRFDINRLEHDARLLRRLSPDRKMAMYWFVLGSIRDLAEAYPRVFSGGSGKIVGNVFDSQLRLLDSLAAHDMTKKDSVRHGLFIDALYAMDEQLRIQEEAREKTGKH